MISYTMRNMKLYLSSYKIGNKGNVLKEMVDNNNLHAVYISNAFDAVNNIQAKNTHEQEDIHELIDLGFSVEHLDLRNFFNKPAELKDKLESFSLIWVSGGNVFVLRQAMKLSGFDKFIRELLDKNIVYGGYSAAVCVLSPKLNGYHIVDDPNANPYRNDSSVIWEGLDLIDWTFAPHFNSDHPESDDIDREIQFCIQNNIPYKALKDGEVIIFDA